MLTAQLGQLPVVLTSSAPAAVAAAVHTRAPHPAAPSQSAIQAASAPSIAAMVPVGTDDDGLPHLGDSDRAAMAALSSAHAPQQPQQHVSQQQQMQQTQQQLQSR
eukprot:6119020-Pyramimonas_sp.AAC.1